MIVQETIAQCRIHHLLYESPNSYIYRGVSIPDRVPVVLKVLKEDYPSPSELTRYRQEFTILQQFHQDSIIKAYRLEPHGRGLAIVLEDFGGISIRELLQKGPISLQRTLEIAITLCEALACVHEQNIIHKDINPSNVLVHPETDLVKVIDFGISTQLSRENPTLKSPEVLEGTLNYISPEQTGRMNRSLDYRTDFYSLGVMLFEMVTGRLPFLSEDPLEIVHAHIARQPPDPREVCPAVPQGLSQLILKLLAKAAEDRYQSALGIQSDLKICLQQLASNGTIIPFALGSGDISDRFQVPQKLYGREKEIATLLAAFDRVTKGKAEFVLVAGFSGIGKSSLVAEVHKPITEKRGYFIAGKFDQYQRNVPYSAVVSAFSDLVAQLLTENEAQLSHWRQTLQEALEPNGQVIIEVIPEVEKILGPQSPVPSLRPTEAQNRFNLFFLKFISVFCTPDHPLVIFLDDLQWADSASLKLIELIMTSASSQCLLLIGAYRDNEVLAGHPLLLLTDFLAQAGVPLEKITLHPLTLDQLALLMQDTLHRDRVSVLPFVELVLQKTEGNPFFVNEFLRSLYNDRLLYFQVQSRRWAWNLQEIKSCATTDNVVDLLIQQLRKLPPIVQERLEIAACLGAHFDLSTLALVGGTDEQEVFADLVLPIQYGLVIALSELTADLVIASFRFGHDRIQQAAYALIPEADRPLVHLKIGRLLWGNVSANHLQERLFTVVDHLNEGTILLTDPQERRAIAQLNLQAGQKARSSAAYSAALNYFQAGLGLLGTQSWEEDYTLTVHLYQEAIEAAYLSQEDAIREQLSQILLEKARSVLDTVKVYQVNILSCSSQNLHRQATDLGLEILGKLGFPFPEITPELLHQELDATKKLYTTATIADLVHLPDMTAPDKLAAMRILSDILSSGYQAVFDRFILSDLKQIDLSIHFGNAQESAFAYDCYGIILCGVTHDIDAGYTFGRLALEVVEKYHDRQSQSRVIFVFNAFVSHWKDPLQATIPRLLEGYQIGLETGDLEYACYSLCWHSMHSLLTGQELGALTVQMAKFSEMIDRLQQEACLTYMRIYQQTVADLLGSGDRFFEEEDFLEKCQHNKLAMAFFFTLQCLLHYTLEQYDQALQAAIAAQNYVDGMTASVTVVILNFYHSLTLLALLPSQEEAARALPLATVAANQEKLCHWATYAPNNHRHKYLLVEAERFRALGQTSAAIECYEQAVQSARYSRYSQEEALICERAGGFYLAIDRLQFGKVYLQDAHYGYRTWGATTKVRLLEKRHPGLFQTSSLVSTTITTSTTGRGKLLDVTAIFRASQSIASEIVFDKLLVSLLEILVNIAGAQRGCILLESQDDLVIEAAIDTETQEKQILQSLCPTGKVASGVVNYVRRTHQQVVLAHASQEGNFIADPYIRVHDSKSILCAPLLNQGGLSGIVYLENNLATGAFTADRLEIIQLLSGQSAIAIDNARLYASLEQKVAERTQTLSQTLAELRATQHELVQSEKMAALGQLIAGIAHEINTPMGAINASIGNIVTAMDQTLSDLPQIFQTLSPDQQTCFLSLIQSLQRPRPNLSTREERQVRRTLTTLLEEAQVPDATALASALVNLGITENPENYLPLWYSPHSELILRTARSLAVQRNNSENIRLAVEKVSKIVFALKSYAHRGEGDKKTLANVQQTIEVVLTIYHNLIKQGIEVIIEAEELPDMYCYPDSLGQVWTNLIHNAIQAMENKGTLKIRVFGEEGSAVVEITDSGKGIPPEIQTRIFDAFFTTKPPGEGSGLGLHIAQEIIAKHQGTMSFTSAPGCTTFRVAFPIVTELPEI